LITGNKIRCKAKKYESTQKSISLDGTSTGNFGLWVFIPDRAKFYGLTIYKGSAANLSKCFSYQWLQGKIRKGWNFLTVNRNAWTNNGSDRWTY
jgi:hypothetical protein